MYVFFFFKQKTAYEMRISDWSSDVCSSDLKTQALSAAKPARRSRFALPWYAWSLLAVAAAYGLAFAMHWDDRGLLRSEERRVGNEVSVRVDLGGRRIIKKKKHITTIHTNINITTDILTVYNTTLHTN